ncbi:UNVERIFIED_CONTAM: hypothetical protein PPO58_09630, partial [Neisseria gonorrhoeae]
RFEKQIGFTTVDFRSSEKECPKYQQREFFRQPLLSSRWNKRRERFFRQSLNSSVECVPQGTHAGVGIAGKMENACVRTAHPTCGLRLARIARYT